jgi:hypothetical protein
MTAGARRGNCYVCVEALYHLLGGKESGWVPHTVRHEGNVHWYLARRLVPPGSRGGTEAPVAMLIRIVLDPTRKQFKEIPPYHLGRGRGFLTRRPSKRARALMKEMLWQEV